jgi:hypothetical protein
MSRPIYCRAEDRQNETRVMEQMITHIRRVAIATSASFAGSHYAYVQAGKLDPYDAILSRDGKNFAVVEIKSRNGDPSRHAEWHIAKHKIDRCLEQSRAMGVKFFLVFAWDGKPFYCLVTEALVAHLRIHVGGRYDRNDAADVEEMYLIPSKLFKAI